MVTELQLSAGRDMLPHPPRQAQGAGCGRNVSALAEPMHPATPRAMEAPGIASPRKGMPSPHRTAAGSRWVLTAQAESQHLPPGAQLEAGAPAAPRSYLNQPHPHDFDTHQVLTAIP